MSYFMKLRNYYQNHQNNNIIDNDPLTDEVFLNSEDIIKVATKLQNSANNSTNSTIVQNSTQNNNNSSNCSNTMSPSSSISSVEFEFSRQNNKTASRGMSCPSTPLPINLSTLLPVSRNNLHDNGKEMPLTTWLQGGSTMLTIPGILGNSLHFWFIARKQEKLWISYEKARKLFAPFCYRLQIFWQELPVFTENRHFSWKLDNFWG